MRPTSGSTGGHGSPPVAPSHLRTAPFSTAIDSDSKVNYRLVAIAGLAIACLALVMFMTSPAPLDNLQTVESKSSLSSKIHLHQPPSAPSRSVSEAPSISDDSDDDPVPVAPSVPKLQPSDNSIPSSTNSEKDDSNSNNESFESLSSSTPSSNALPSAHPKPVILPTPPPKAAPLRPLTLPNAAFHVNLSANVFPPDREGISCSVPGIKPVEFPLIPKTCPPVPKFARIENDQLIMGDECDGRAYMMINADGFTTRPEERITELVTPLEGAETVIVECRKGDWGLGEYNFFARNTYNQVAAARSRRIRASLPRHIPTEVEEAQAANIPPWPPGFPTSVKPTIDWSYGVHSILFLSFDSVSRANFIRSLPKTLAALETLQNTGVASVFDFERFNIIGSGTARNMPAFIRGMQYADMHAKGHVQNPSIWDYFHEHGFITAFAEETCHRSPGSVPRVWHQKPKAPLSEKEEELYLLHMGKLADHSYQNIWCDVMIKMGVGSFFSHNTAEKLCFSGRFLHEYTLDWIRDFYQNYQDPGLARVAFGMFLEGHEETSRRIATMDQHLSEFLLDHYAKYPDTVTILMADHGIGYGEFSTTKPGHLEYKLPAHYWVMPNDLLVKYPHIGHNMLANTQKLISAFDIYETLRHLMRPHEVHKRVSEHPGYSMLGHIPNDRTCADAEIPIQFCSCSGYESISNPNATIFMLLADLAVHQINTRSHFKPPVDRGAIPQTLIDAELAARTPPAPAQTTTTPTTTTTTANTPRSATPTPAAKTGTATTHMRPTRPTATTTTQTTLPQSAPGARALLAALNAATAEKSNCYNLKVHSIEEVKVMTSATHKRKDDDGNNQADTLAEKRKSKEKVEATEVTTDRRFSITFKAGNDHNKETETFEAYFVSNPESSQAAGRLISLRVGSNYDKTLKSFTDEQLLPKDVGAIWGACEWRKETKNIEYRLDWFSPSSLAAAHGTPKSPTPFYTKTITIPADVSHPYTITPYIKSYSPFSHSPRAPALLHLTKRQRERKQHVHSWMSFVHTGTLESGEWQVLATRTSDKALVGETYFYVRYPTYPGISMADLGRYWTVEFMRRVSKYERHQPCTPAELSPEFCVC